MTAAGRTTRKPIVYLVVVLPILVGGGSLLVAGLHALYRGLEGGSPIPMRNGLLICLPALVLWAPIAFLLSNWVLYAMPPLRRIADAYVAESGAPGFRESQGQLTRIASMLAWVCLPLVLLGFVI